MFNRQLQIDVVKKGTTPDAPYDQLEVDLERRVTVVSEAVGNGIKKIGWVVFGYVVLDTVRQVVIASTKN